jgi:diguanylate cyclase (GGDEF)-like protein/PAS domain S-box-containing protein
MGNMGRIQGNISGFTFEKLLNGYARLKIILNHEGIPVDAIFNKVNAVFEDAFELELKQLIGKKLSELFPELLIRGSIIWETIEKVVTKSIIVKTEYYHDRWKKWFSVVMFSETSQCVTVIIHDITGTKRAAAQVEILAKTALKYLEFPFADIDYQMIADDLLHLAGAKFTIINTYNRDGNYGTVQAVAGDSAGIEKAQKIIGTIVGRSRTIENFGFRNVNSKGLTKISGIHELLLEKASSQRSIELENALQIGDIYCFAINHSEKLLGNAFIIMPKGAEITSSNIIELYASQLEAVLLRKNAEMELNNLTNQYATVFNGSQDLMYLVKVGPDGEFFFDMVNKKCEERFQLPKETIKDKSVVDLFGKEYGGSLAVKFQQSIETRAPVIYEETYNFLGQARIGHTVLSPVIKDGKVAQIIGSTRDITEQKQAEARIKYLSFYDDLTGLFNRAFFEEELKRLDAEGQLPISLIIIDVNGLKFVNDAFGHGEGDRILIDTTRIIEKSCRREDIICRWGGDEFIILLPQCSEEDAEEICQRIKKNPLKNNRNLIPISLALGTATKKEASQNIQGVLSDAENRVYRNKLLESKSSRSSVLASLQKTLQERTHETEEHEQRLRNLALKIGRAIGLSGNELDELVLLAALHDIGKIAVPDHILKKPGPLSSEEWIIMKGHSEIGYRIALAAPELASISELILTHHERWDGAGYPKGLKGKEIPLLSRILSIIDAFDAMTNNRPYRKGTTKEKAFAELNRNAGTQFDPGLVKIFIETQKVKKNDNLM